MHPRPVGTRRVLALAVLLAAVGAVAYLEKAMAGSVDVQLVYFLIVLSGAVLLPRAVTLAVAGGAAVVSSGISGDSGVVLAVNILTHFMIYGYAALLTSNWEYERRRLMKMSRIDELTGLHNLRALREQLPVWLGPAARTGRPMAIMMVDVDGFKAVNDRLGHGDRQRVAQGGREPATVCGSGRRRAVSLRWRRVRAAPIRRGRSRRGARGIADPGDVRVDGADVARYRRQQISFSIGIAVFPGDGQTPEVLELGADEALYEAKHAGAEKIALQETPPTPRPARTGRDLPCS